MYTLYGDWCRFRAGTGKVNDWGLQRALLLDRDTNQGKVEVLELALTESRRVVKELGEKCTFAHAAAQERKDQLLQTRRSLDLTEQQNHVLRKVLESTLTESQREVKELKGKCTVAQAAATESEERLTQTRTLLEAAQQQNHFLLEDQQTAWTCAATWATNFAHCFSTNEALQWALNVKTIRLEETEWALREATQWAEDLSIAKWKAEETAASASQRNRHHAADLCRLQEDLQEAKSQASKLQEWLVLETAKCHEYQNALNSLKTDEDAWELKLQEERKMTNKASGALKALRTELQVFLKSSSENASNHEDAGEAMDQTVADVWKLVQEGVRLKGALEQQLKDLRAEAEVKQATIDSLYQEISSLCTCDLTGDIMKEPVTGPDMRTYELEAIRAWVQRKPTSPHTRMFMDESLLRADRIVPALNEIRLKYWNTKEREGRGILAKAEGGQKLVGMELVKAICDRKANAALELLAQPVRDDVLNKMLKVNGVPCTLLQVALYHYLPDVARAIASRVDFRRNSAKSADGLSAIHVAAVLGYVDVCAAIVADQGRSMLSMPILCEACVQLPNREKVVLNAGSTVLSIARSRGPQALLELCQSVGQTAP